MRTWFFLSIALLFSGSIFLCLVAVGQKLNTEIVLATSSKIHNQVIEKKVVKSTVVFPYIPTYLSFREYPLIKKVIAKIENKPTILMVDGNGILHPFGVGLASHVGVLQDISTIGIAKSLLCGEFDDIGEISEVILDGILIGYSLRNTKQKH